MKRKGLFRLVLSVTVVLVAFVCTVSVLAVPTGYFPFMPKVVADAWTETDYPASAANVRDLVLDAPAGKHGYVQVRDGHFVLENTGERIKFWGMNMVHSANFPTEQAEADAIADDLANMGVNLVRLHGFDSNLNDSSSIFQNHNNNTYDLNTDQLDRLDYFVYALKQRGIYINLNLNSKRVFVEGDEVQNPSKVSSSGGWKPMQLVDDQLIGLQKQFAQQLLGHVNPYTGLSYAEEPAIAMIELTNENSLFRKWKEGALDDLSERYSAVMDQKWNEWLTEKYGTSEALSQAWSGVEENDNFLINPGFEEEDISMYTFQTKNRGQGTFERDTTFATEGTASAKIEVTQGGSALDSVEFFQPGFSIEKGKSYIVQFDAKASTSWPLRVYLRMPGMPMTVYGSSNFTISDTPQSYHFSFVSKHTSSNVSFYMRMGMVAGTLWFDNLYVSEISSQLSYILGEQEWIRYSERNQYPQAVMLDFSEFLRDTEQSTLNELRRFLREDLGAAQPVSGNNLYSGLADLSAQNDMDFTSGHAYFDHPTFLTGWNELVFQMTNKSMVASALTATDPRTSMFGLLSFTAVEGKPSVAGEWNLAFPNPHEYEAPILAATIAAIQDWDAMILFAYSHSRNDGNGIIRPWFDTRLNPAKRAQMSAAALLFHRGYISPAENTLTMDYTRDDTMHYGLLNPTTASIFSDAEVTPALLMDTRLRRGSFEAEATTSVVNALGQEKLQHIQTGQVHQSADGQMVWDLSESGAENVVINAPLFQGFIGFIGGRQQQADNLWVWLNEGHNAAVSLVSTDGVPLENSDRMLLTICGKQQNKDQPTGSIWLNWGSSHVNVQQIMGEAAITLAQPDAYTVYPLAEDGTRMEPLQATIEANELRFTLNNQALWYEIVK